jgi:Squalene-hopene cyclase N-terminal domain
MNQLTPGQFGDLDGSIRAATDAILAQQRPDGHWVYELEADATIPAEYVLLVHYLAETPNLELNARSASICAASRARMAAGRFIMRVLSTSRPR